MSTVTDHHAFAEVLRRPIEDLPDPLPMVPLSSPFDVDIRTPGSKSLTNRAILLAALAKGASKLNGALVEADDAERMAQALRLMGAKIDLFPGGQVSVIGVAGKLQGNVSLNLGGAGTAVRFLTAAAILASGDIEIDGGPRMRERPIGQLLLALKGLGLTVDSLGHEGYLPIRLSPPKGEIRKDHLTLPTTSSSQFISALLLLAPWLPRGLTIELKGEITSKSYILMTLELLRRLGAQDVRASHDCSKLHVGHGPLTGFNYDVEPDASGATYFWAAAAINPGSTCFVNGLGADSLQGDITFPRALAQMGAMTGITPAGIAVGALANRAHRAKVGLRGIVANMSNVPDTTMTLAAVASFAEGQTRLSGLRTLRDKESDRIDALINELAKINVVAEPSTDGTDVSLIITPPEGGIDCGGGSASVPRVNFRTYDDHRMAMSLALIGLRRPNVHIMDPGCVAKTYPTFWADLALLYDTPAG